MLSRSAPAFVKFSLTLLALTASCLVVPAGSFAQTAWQPGKPVEFIVPAGAGAALDTAARVVAQILGSEKAVNQPMIVINKPGGGGALMLAYFNQHAGNGAVLGTIAPTLLTSKITGMINQSYSDFTPLAVLFDEYVAVAVRADSPVKNAHDLVEQLGRDPRVLSIGVAAALGNHVHIGIALPLEAAGVDVKRLRVIAYKSSTDSLAGMLSRDLDVVAATVSNMVPLIQSKKIRVIAISSPKRLGGALADVPTWKEQGIEVELVASQGVMGPKGLSSEQIAYWDRAFAKLSRSEDYKRHLEQHFWVANFRPHDEAVKYYHEQYAKMKKVLTDLGMAKEESAR